MGINEQVARNEWRRLQAMHPALQGIPLKVNKRLRKTLGRARFRGKDPETGRYLPYCLEIAGWVAEAETMRRQVEDTVRHEAAHFLAGHEAGHGPVWKAWAKKVGANPERCADLTTEQRMEREQIVGADKWLIECEPCGVSGTRSRLGRHLQDYGGLCRKCGEPVTITNRHTGRKSRVGGF